MRGPPVFDRRPLSSAELSPRGATKGQRSSVMARGFAIDRLAPIKSRPEKTPAPGPERSLRSTLPFESHTASNPGCMVKRSPPRVMGSLAHNSDSIVVL